MSRFAGLNSSLAGKAAAPEALESTADARQPAGHSRDGKKAVVGYFSADLSRQIKGLAASEGTTVQSLLGEAIDLLMRDRGKHPFGER